MSGHPAPLLLLSSCLTLDESLAHRRFRSDMPSTRHCANMASTSSVKDEGLRAGGRWAPRDGEGPWFAGT